MNDINDIFQTPKVTFDNIKDTGVLSHLPHDFLLEKVNGINVRDMVDKRSFDDCSSKSTVFQFYDCL